MQSAIYEGFVRHRRFEPTRHEFRATLFMMYLDLAEVAQLFDRRWFWSVETWNLATFRRRDHVGDVQVSLDTTIRNLVESKIGSRPPGAIRLLTHLRYFGYCFNPISLYFCFDAAGTSLHSVVAEVTNTPWGERHCYVLDAGDDASQTRLTVNSQSEDASVAALKPSFRFPKAFHVSPFMEMDAEYQWKLSGPGEHLVLHSENWQRGQRLFDATLNLHRREITSGSLSWMLIRYPVVTLQIIAMIHWQAFRLWWKRVPYVPHPRNGEREFTSDTRDPSATERATKVK